VFKEQNISLLSFVMPCRVKYPVVLLVLLLSAPVVCGQNRLGTGFSISPVVCFTDLAPRLSGMHSTTPEFSDMFNFSTAMQVDYQLDAGMAFTLGAEFGRRRFGFLHEGEIEQSPVNLWGHSEYYTFSMPLQLSYVVYSHSDPYFDVAPYAGASAGVNLTSYRNITRLDESYDRYAILRGDYRNGSFMTGLQVGVNVRTIIDQLGLVYWGIGFSSDLVALPSFDYSLVSGDVTESFSQHIRMNLVSLSIYYYFNTWEVFEGRIMRRRFN
jgi:hypothetical protein